MELPKNWINFITFNFWIKYDPTFVHFLPKYIGLCDWREDYKPRQRIQQLIALDSEAVTQSLRKSHPKNKQTTHEYDPQSFLMVKRWESAMRKKSVTVSIECALNWWRRFDLKNSEKFRLKNKRRVPEVQHSVASALNWNEWRDTW